MLERLSKFSVSVFWKHHSCTPSRLASQRALQRIARRWSRAGWKLPVRDACERRSRVRCGRRAVRLPRRLGDAAAPSLAASLQFRETSHCRPHARRLLYLLCARSRIDARAEGEAHSEKWRKKG